MKNTSNNQNSIDKEVNKTIIKKREEGKYTINQKDVSPTFDSFIENSGIITDNEYEVKSEMDYNEKNE